MVTGSLKSMLRFTCGETPPTPAPGRWLATVGGRSGWVVKLAVWLPTIASMLPSRSVTRAPVTVTVQISRFCNGVAGVARWMAGVLALTFRATLPDTVQARVIAPGARVTGSLKVAVSVGRVETSLAPSAGSSDSRVGGTSTAGTKLWPGLQAPKESLAGGCQVKSL